MVVLASFLCVAIVDGVGYTTGLMLERCFFWSERKNFNAHLSSLKSELGGSRGAIAVVGSLQVSTSLSPGSPGFHLCSGWCLLFEWTHRWQARQ